MNFIFFIRDEEKRKMCHSISIKNIHRSSSIISNNNEEEIHDLMLSLLDKIDKEINLSNDTSCMLFDASSNNRHRISSDNNDDLFQVFDDCKHSSGILVDEKNLSPRKLEFKYRVFLNFSIKDVFDWLPSEIFESMLFHCFGDGEKHEYNSFCC